MRRQILFGGTLITIAMLASSVVLLVFEPALFLIWAAAFPGLRRTEQNEAVTRFAIGRMMAAAQRRMHSGIQK